MFELRLIDEVKKYQCIYNKDNVDFRNKEVKEVAWYKIESAVGQPEEKCRIRWKTLRERYVKEYLKMAEKPKYKSVWRFTEAMSFLKRYVGVVRSYSLSEETRARKEFNNKSCSKLFENILIEEIKKYPFIYDREHPDFRNKQVKAEAWAEISHCVNASDHQCQRRWKTLRDRAVNEHFKITAGRGYKSHWRFMEAMSFMNFSATPKAKRIKEPVFKFTKRDMYCRTCLNQILNEDGTEQSLESYNIFVTTTLAQMLKQCSNTKIETWDEYPHSVCLKCYEKILNFYQFQQMCSDSLNKFQKILEEQIQVKYENDYEETMDNEQSCLTDSTNMSYNERFEENVTQSSSPLSEEEHLDYTNDSHVEVVKEITTDDPLAEPSIFEERLTFNKIFEVPHEANCRGDEVRCDERAKRSIRNAGNKTANAYAIRGTSLNSVRKKLEKTSKGGPADRKCQTLVVDVSQDTSYEEEVSILDNTMAATGKIKLTGHQFKCDICPKTYSLKYRLQAHRRKHIVMRDYPCTYGKCQRSFSRLELLRKHLNDHNSRLVFKCNIGDCERVYKNRSTLSQHKINYHNGEEEKRGYVCDVCGKKFFFPLSLKNHHFIHHDKSQWPYVCDVEGCNQRFQRPYLYKAHKKRHDVIKNHVCPYCGLRSTTRAEMNRHINIHTFERKYPCPVCPKVCKSTSDRGNHIRRVHGRPQIYPCRMCEGKFTSSYNRNHHEMSHRGIKPYSCDQCDKQFKWKMGLKMHQKIVHLGAEPFKCEICGKEFGWYGSLTKHKRTHLKEDDAKVHQDEDTGDGSVVNTADNMDNLIDEDVEFVEYTFEVQTDDIEFE